MKVYKNKAGDSICHPQPSERLSPDSTVLRLTDNCDHGRIAVNLYDA